MKRVDVEGSGQQARPWAEQGGSNRVHHPVAMRSVKGRCRSAASRCCRSSATSQGFGHPGGICPALLGIEDSGERSRLANGSE